jgi:hypothetical protein
MTGAFVIGPLMTVVGLLTGLALRDWGDDRPRHLPSMIGQRLGQFRRSAILPGSDNSGSNERSYRGSPCQRQESIKYPWSVRVRWRPLRRTGVRSAPECGVREPDFHHPSARRSSPPRQRLRYSRLFRPWSGSDRSGSPNRAWRPDSREDQRCGAACWNCSTSRVSIPLPGRPGCSRTDFSPDHPLPTHGWGRGLPVRYRFERISANF